MINPIDIACYIQNVAFHFQKIEILFGTDSLDIILDEIPHRTFRINNEGRQYLEAQFPSL